MLAIAGGIILAYLLIFHTLMTIAGFIILAGIVMMLNMVLWMLDKLPAPSPAEPGPPGVITKTLDRVQVIMAAVFFGVVIVILIAAYFSS